MNDNISQKVLEKIKNEKIVPTPKWYFLLKNYLLWGVFSLALIIGSLAVSVFILAIRNNHAFELLILGNSLNYKIFRMLPYFWIILITAFIALAYFNLRYTKDGYRINPYLIIVGNIVISIFLGTIIYFTGLAAKIESFAYHKIPFYENFYKRQNRFWVEPKAGYLGGIVREIKINNNEFKLHDFTDQNWIIIYNSQALTPPKALHNCVQKKPEKPCLISLFELEIGQRVGLIGEEIAPGKFRAIKIRPLIWSKKLPKIEILR